MSGSSVYGASQIALGNDETDKSQFPADDVHLLAVDAVEKVLRGVFEKIKPCLDHLDLFSQQGVDIYGALLRDDNLVSAQSPTPVRYMFAPLKYLWLTL